ncbi:bifunctional adenosylcobinamide kinase/adenosylcobinamide-phosphate guanylyltransferase [Vallicoccus soli]|uniref:Adenosylcobinamide kinase n=1 Tax=Vallicoccus soli TaxID=2339232 RepID=A0A3A3Z7V1_9ACTN|nr:bifunctional adenosylcobinamide kinase/adenosylcobinamide-phosphate guanylyltransferase [Vallicoccus soli]RJK96917.1 adenosylcobinamide kinase/adenosylcobinamide phosphate guanyltransferase [Vallicoccus soli]
MEVVLLGTGGAAGCPRPTCACPTCSALRQRGAWHGPTAVLVDGALLLGGGPHVVAAAARAGRSLAGLGRVVALPGTAGAPAPVAPVPPHALRQPAPGVVDVRGPDGDRLLLAAAPLGPPVLDATAGAAYDVVVLALPLAAAVPALAALRASGAAAPRTRVVLAGLDHDAPPPDELARRARAWGVQVGEDGLVVGGPAAPPRPHRVLVLGGARSGKSLEAERRLGAEPRVRYVATAPDRPGDAEWAERVAAHRARRPPGWRTTETSDVAGALAVPGPPLLVDCLGLWLTGVVDGAGPGAWDGDPAARERVRRRVDELVTAWSGAAAPVVAVSNEVGSGVVPATASGRLFRDELGRLNALVAAASDEVLLVVAGQALRLR